MALERLDKILSSTGRWSRKEIKDMIRHGRVRADGTTVAKPEEKFDPASTHIQVDGQTVDCAPFVYVLMHKPAGLLSATRDPKQKTVLDLLPQHLRRRGLFPVGRLDKDTTGLLLLTDDGPLGHELLSPKKHVDKVPARRTKAPGGRLNLAGHPAGGKVSPGEADVGRPGKAGDRPASPVYGSLEIGGKSETWPVADAHRERNRSIARRMRIPLGVFHKKIVAI